MAEVLTQEEIDALLNSADEIDVEQASVPDSVQPYDFVMQDKVSRAGMPNLEVLNERFSRSLRTSMFSLMRQPAEVSLNGVHMLKYGEYINTLKMPTSMNMVRFRPFRGIALVDIEVRLVFTLVDNFFGGTGKFNPKGEGVEFTPTEQHIIDKLLRIIFSDYKQAWEPLMDTNMEFVQAEYNPQMVNIVSATEVVIINSFHIEMDGGGGDFHITMPYSMLDPIRDLLTAELQADISDNDEKWQQSLREELMEVNVSLDAKLLEKSLTLQDIMELDVGDIIPVDIPEHILLSVEDLPSFRCKLGKSRDHLALKISKKIPRPKIIKSQLPELSDSNKSKLSIAKT